MFSGLSKLADKPFILGYLVPAMFGLSALALANHDIPIFAGWLRTAAKGDKTLGDVASLLLALWGVALFLSQLNLPAFKILEGYWWPFNLSLFVNREKDRFQALKSPYSEARRQYWEAIDTIELLSRQNADAELIEREKEKASDAQVLTNALAFEFRREFIEDGENYVLGTRFGNVVRAFEDYPAAVYGASSIAVWPRLIDVISKEYLEVISDARAAVDMWLSFIVVLFGVCIFAFVRLLIPHSLSFPKPDVATVAITVVACMLLMRVCYAFAIRCAGWWGETYRAAYDNYLGTLEKKLGFDLPNELASRKAFWLRMSDRFRYFDEGEMPVFAKPATAQAAGEAGKAASHSEAVEAAEASEGEKPEAPADSPSIGKLKCSDERMPDASREAASREKPAQQSVGDDA